MLLNIAQHSANICIFTISCVYKSIRDILASLKPTIFSVVLEFSHSFIIRHSKFSFEILVEDISTNLLALQMIVEYFKIIIS